MKNKVAITVGYYQPFHNEHEKLLKKLSNDYIKVVVYVICPNLNNSEHPFTLQEVKKMIRNSLNDLLNYEIKIINSLKDVPIKNNYVYFCTDKKFNIANITTKYHVNLKLNETDLINSIYNKDLTCLKHVNEKNFKYLRRLVIPF
jgi:nicotinamide mononucleotide adenylyltransferase